MSDSNNSSDVKSKETNEKLQDFGYDLYPERRGQRYSSSASKVLFKGEGREFTEKFKCEQNVYSCIKNSKIIIYLLLL